MVKEIVKKAAAQTAKKIKGVSRSARPKKLINYNEESIIEQPAAKASKSNASGSLESIEIFSSKESIPKVSFKQMSVFFIFI